MDATEAVFRGYKQFQSALQEIATDDNQTGDTRNQANALAKQTDTKEVAFMCELGMTYCSASINATYYCRALALNLSPLLV